MIEVNKEPAINQQIAFSESKIDVVICRVFNANNVPPGLIQTIKQYQHNLLDKGVAHSIYLKESVVKQCDIQIGNTTLDIKNISPERLEKALTDHLQAPSSLESLSLLASGQLNWNFLGINQFEHITIRIEGQTWEVEFARLHRSVNSQLPLNAELKAKAHQEVYQRLMTEFESLSPSDSIKVVILQGTSGLGKTHCAQHYFYHDAKSKHQMIAWLSGQSEEAFLKDWRVLAQQLRNLQSSQVHSTDHAVIQDWCQNKLGQWLFIIDEVNVKSEWLIKYLPQKGGHVLLTTHQPDYHLHQDQIILIFSPLSREDSQVLLKAYLGKYWQATRRLQEEKALEYLTAVLGGFPVLLAQMALLVHKKSLSFERVAVQFKQPEIRSHLLNDTVFDQLKGETFIASVQKGWEQLCVYFKENYSHLNGNQHEENLKQFMHLLNQTAEKSLAAVTEDGIPVIQISSDIVQGYWQKAIEKIDFQKLKSWLHCLPLHYNHTAGFWELSLASLCVLKLQSGVKALKILGDKEKEIPKKEISSHISLSLLNALSTEEDKVNSYFIPRPQLTDELSAKLPQKKEGEESVQLILTVATSRRRIEKTEGEGNLNRLREWLVDKNYKLEAIKLPKGIRNRLLFFISKDEKSLLAMGCVSKDWNQWQKSYIETRKKEKGEKSKGIINISNKK